jgi:SAM-dependent methyltransferase
MAQDSSKAEFWDTRYASGVMPWDAGGAPGRLARWLASEAQPLRVLVPGCGSGYEVKLFAERGHDVLGIDFSDEALAAARRVLAKLADRVRKADFFSLDEGPFDLLYERTFMCALPKRLRSAWARRVAELVRPGGELAGFFFFDDNERGPPFGISPRELHELLDEGFTLAEDEPVPAHESVDVLKGKERWQVWKRRL